MFGSNDYFGPRLKNPMNYLTSPDHRVRGAALPWQDLRAAFTERGWLDLTHTRREFEVAGLHIAAAGVDDPHIDRDRYDTIAGPASPAANLRLGLTHSPEPRVLDRFAADGYQLVLAGHTHGGSCACRCTGRWSLTAVWTAPGPKERHTGVQTCGCTSPPGSALRRLRR